MKPPPIRFDPFTLDPDSLELRREGRRVPLPPQPARALLVLLQRPGEVVKREELAELLWTDRHVAVDQGLNSCIRQLRRSLGDSATDPLYVETLPRIGYRFIASVEGPQPEKPQPENSEPADSAPEAAIQAVRGQEPEDREEKGTEAVPVGREGRRGLMVVLLCGFLAVLVAGIVPELLHLEVHVGAAEANLPVVEGPVGESPPAVADSPTSLSTKGPLRGETPCLSGGGRRQPAGAQRKPVCPGSAACEEPSAGSQPSAPSIQIVVRLKPRTVSRVESEGATGDPCRLCRWRQGLARLLILPLDRLTGGA
ncbi:MAG: transcriptional regulator [Acidobacteriota bacterium]|nr:transcriptional regulator [Acidobacteriota bacterium]